MTDLADNLGPTLACQECAAEVAIEVAVRNGFDCPQCGASLPERPDYAVEGATTPLEIVRAYGSYGYIDDYTLGDDGTYVCPGCSTILPAGEFTVDARREVDQAAGPSATTTVLALRCPKCKTAGTLVIDPEVPGEG
jgi:Zn finger protein HypA/HybF involved in hydrogenase expression